MSDYRQHTTDETVRFVITMKPGELERLQSVENGLYKTFKLMTQINTGQMHAFDSNSCLRKYETPADLIKEFYGVRYKYYQMRKEYMIGQYGAVANSLSARARFIEEKCAGTLTVENKKKKELIKELIKRGFPSDPIAEWKKKTPQDHEKAGTGGASGGGGGSDEDEEPDDSGYDYNYLVGMSMWFLTEEKKQQLLREREQKLAELSKLKMMSIEQMWLDELSELEVALEAFEKKELLELENAGKEKVKKVKGVKAEPVPKGRKGAKGKNRALEDFKPSDDAIRIDFQLSDAEKAKYVKAEPKPPGAVKKEKGAAGVAVKQEKNADGSVVEAGDGLDDLDALIAGKKKPAAAAPKAAAAVKVKKEKTDGMKQSKLDFSGGAKKRTPKKKKAGSDDEDDLSDAGSNSDVEFSINEVVPTRDRPSGRAASKKINYNFDDDEEEKSDGEPELFDNTMVSEGAGKQGALSDSDEEMGGAANGQNNASAEDMFDSLREEEETPAKKKAAPKKKPAAAPAAKRKPTGSDEEVVKKVSGRERQWVRLNLFLIKHFVYFQAPAKKKPKYLASDDSGSDGDFTPGKKAGGKKAAGGGGKKKKKAVSDSESDFEDY